MDLFKTGNIDEFLSSNKCLLEKNREKSKSSLE